ncbi:F-box domain [Plasmopara halstedii]|uniref:F-box domain n=1 Tax=Plasmopara halstedii TaxID=4781 RepID=A0A0P1A9T0_PLAHL|nr:F-box domain [Plasmopara halstedii]CEG36842.1 F-box domain [Plasmopara halstedii]|eukprot:XP_024573211.1 F-box domain [Plasmopara halstedii]
MSTLPKLPLELLELNICQYLDVKAILQLGLVNRTFQDNITQCSKLWKTLMIYHFGYMSKSQLPQVEKSIDDDNKTSEIRWRTVFAVAWQDSIALTQSTLREIDVLRLYRKQACNNVSLLLQPKEAWIRQEVILMEGLRRIPKSKKLIQLYAEVIRQAQLVARIGGAGTEWTLHGKFV